MCGGNKTSQFMTSKGIINGRNRWNRLPVCPRRFSADNEKFIFRPNYSAMRVGAFAECRNFLKYLKKAQFALELMRLYGVEGEICDWGSHK
jgi:hypothetical protein